MFCEERLEPAAVRQAVLGHNLLVNNKQMVGMLLEVTTMRSVQEMNGGAKQ